MVVAEIDKEVILRANERKVSERTAVKNVAHRRDIIPRELLDLSPNLIIVLSQDGTILEVNRPACNVLMRKEYELVNSSWYQFSPENEHERIKQLFKKCLVSSKTHSIHTKLLSTQGAIIDVEASLSRYPRTGKSPERYCVFIGRDISEDKKKELDLLRFSNIAHYTVNPVEITDAEGRIIYVNPAFEKASGFAKEELLGKNPSIFGSGKHPKAFWSKMWATIKSGKVWFGEVENRRRNGEPFYTQLLVSPVIDSDGRMVGYFGVHRDLSERKQLQEQLIHAQKMESIGLLAAGIAHEVGNPLTSISSLVQVIQRTTKDEFVQDKLELIKNQISRISRIIRDLVDFSRRSSYEVQLTDVNKSLREATEIVRVGKKAKAILFQVDLAEHIPMLPLVPDQIEQVFINILINAVDAVHSYTDHHATSHTGLERGEINVRSVVDDENVVITIQDNGGGILEEHLPKIFEPFFTTKKVGEGTGLGLWVSYGIIKSFQGSIKVDSLEGRGTTFTIVLPQHSEIL